MPRCECCGRFMKCERGAAGMLRYSGHPPTPDRELYRCKNCVEKHGPFTPQHGIKPEASCWLFK